MNVCSRESNPMQVWVMIREVCCLGGCLLKRIHMAVVPWAMRDRQAWGRGKEKDFPWPGHGWEWWNTVVSLLSWLLPKLGWCLGCHPHPSHLPCSISSSLDSLGLPFQLSGLTLPSPLPLPGLPKQQLGLGSCSLSSGGKTQIALICQGGLSQAGDSCKINLTLVAAWEQKSC